MPRDRVDIKRTSALMQKIKNPPKEYIAKTDATTNIIPGASQIGQELTSVPSDWELEEKYDITPDPINVSGRNKRSTLRQKRKYELYNARMNEMRSTKPSVDTLVNKIDMDAVKKKTGTWCPECKTFHED